MKNNKNLFALFVLILGLASCEQNNQFDRGPIYDPVANLEIERKLIDTYLATAEIDSLYRIHDPSGVVIIVQEQGSGTRPTRGTVVHTDYTGSLMSDGSIFDTSLEDVARENDIYVDGRNYSFLSIVIGTGGVIRGWDIGFRRLRPGSKAIFIIPSPYGYEAQNKTGIPPNSVLVFDVDFRGID
jgi:FKBP-type peptidyl-prolyl cis-trans isomerase FkpA